MEDFNLSFSVEDIDTHSICSGGGVMALCLAKVDTYVIILQYCWKSDAFMK